MRGRAGQLGPSCFVELLSAERRDDASAVEQHRCAPKRYQGRQCRQWHDTRREVVRELTRCDKHQPAHWRAWFNPPLRNRTDCINAGGGANLVARIIATGHWPICNIPESISNSGPITLSNCAQDRIATATTLRRICRD